MSEIASVSGSSSSVSSASSSTSSRESGASTAAKASETPASSSAPSGNSSTIERAEQVQVSSNGSSASHSALVGDTAQSDPENSKEVAAVQAEVAQAVTGSSETSGRDSAVVSAPNSDDAAVSEIEAQTPVGEEEPASDMSDEQKARLEEYEEARALLDSYTTITALQESAEVQAKLLQAEEIVFGHEEEYRVHVDQLRKSFADLDQQVTYQSTFLSNEGRLLSEPELAAAQEFTASRVSEAMAPFEEATRAMLDTVREPAFQAYLRDLEPEDQQKFFDDMVRYMPASETGREWLGELTDGLATLGREGETSNLTAEVAAALRDTLEPNERLKLEGNLGVMVGADLAGRPEGADQRLLDIAEALGLPDSELQALKNPESADFEQLGRFGQSVGTSFEIFESMNRQISGTDLFAQTSSNLSYVGMGVDQVKRISNLAKGSRVLGAALGMTDDGLGRLSNGLNTLGRGISVVSLGFSAASAAHQLSQGNHDAAFDGLVGIAGGAAATFGTGGVALAGYALIGASMALPHLRESANYQQYVNGVTQTVLGDSAVDTLRGEMITYSPPNAAYLLDQLRPPNMSSADYLNSRLESFSSNATGAGELLWKLLQSEVGDLHLQQAEAAALLN